VKFTRRQITGVLEILCRELEKLRHFYVIVQEISHKISSSEDEGRDFVCSIYEAAWRAFLIGLAGLTSTDQESITINYLLDLAANHPHSFRFSDQKSIQEFIARSRGMLLQLDPIERKLRSERDRRLAHLDRKLINEPDLFEADNIRLEDADHVLEIAEQIVSTLYLYYYGEPIEFLKLSDKYKSQLKIMLALMDS
jgi:hypothetical protein